MDNKSLIKKFEDEVEQADWSMLKPHFERDAIWLIEDSLNLFETAVAIATDDVNKIKKWKDTKKIRELFPEEIAEWDNGPFKKIVNFIILTPFVIIQKI
jgi:hypothetical protein